MLTAGTGAGAPADDGVDEQAATVAIIATSATGSAKRAFFMTNGGGYANEGPDTMSGPSTSYFRAELIGGPWNYGRALAAGVAAPTIENRSRCEPPRRSSSTAF